MNTQQIAEYAPLAVIFRASVLRSYRTVRHVEAVGLTDWPGSRLVPLPPAGMVSLRKRRCLKGRGTVAGSPGVDAVLVARPLTSDHARRLPPGERTRLRAVQRDVVVGLISRYNPEAVVCVGIPFGHTRWQWIVPHGGLVTVDGAGRRVIAGYS